MRQCSCAMHTQKQRKHAQQQTRECRNLGISHASEVAKSTLARQRAFNNVPEGLGSDATHLSLAPQLRVSRVWRCLRGGGTRRRAGWPLSLQKSNNCTESKKLLASNCRFVPSPPCPCAPPLLADSEIPTVPCELARIGPHAPQRTPTPPWTSRGSGGLPLACLSSMVVRLHLVRRVRPRPVVDATTACTIASMRARRPAQGLRPLACEGGRGARPPP